MFQSLIGFKINWNVSSDEEAVVFYEFQSLIGFKINWNSGSKELGLRCKSFNP
ncbi:hypothetical protein MYAER_3652 [Microcystis aeruginosa NIES-2549]|uniref:Uncharacterized protein n=1 Tax=Microcystis aeruginosa NIES-2549 TaxID=1641812 RepID=A0A0F6RNA7_MICAE|nr:hypothetical protein MYAER_3652 [Microcystis aeruginosa NIES-2549]AOC54395.1 hypothetical protein amyaer_3698 [Microcystis aeruginosa NIES-2481]